jgi:hypothetical protein
MRDPKTKILPTTRVQVAAFFAGLILGVMILALAMTPVGWLLGLAPNGEVFATGKAQVVEPCETGFSQLWVIQRCPARVTWSDGKQELKQIESTRVLTGEVDVVYRRDWVKPKRRAAHYVYSLTAADHRTDTNGFWGIVLTVVGFGGAFGLAFLGMWLFRPRPQSPDKPAPPPSYDWKSKIYSRRERQQRFNGPKSRR